MNSVNLIGRLGRDPELKKTASGVSSCYVSIAVDKDWKTREDEDKADWFPIQLWRQSADFLCDYASKGDKIAVTGRLRTYKKDGQTVTYVEADRVEICGSGKKEQSTGTVRKSPSSKKRQDLPAATPEQIAQWEFEETGKEIDPDELPF